MKYQEKTKQHIPHTLFLTSDALEKRCSGAQTVNIHHCNRHKFSFNMKQEPIGGHDILRNS